MAYEPILPLKAIVFQVLFLLVAIAIEAGILRQRLRLGFQTSMQYATVTNLAAVVAGWMVFLILEPLSPMEVKAQIMSYVLFNRLLVNGWTTQLGATLFAIALVAFFGTFLIKAKGLEYFLRADKAWVGMKKQPQPLTRDDRYARARGSGSGSGEDASQSISDFTDTVIQANAASFSVILLLLLVRFAIQGWST